MTARRVNRFEWALLTLLSLAFLGYAVLFLGS
jgi:hypothetical protein